MKWLSLAVLMFGLLLAGCGFEQVDTGHRGVKTTFGEVDMKSGSMPEGFYTYNPITSSIREMDVRIKVLKNTTNTYTKDVQQADITYVVNYQLQPDVAHVMFKDVGVSWENTVLVPVVEGAFKQVIGQWDAVELISNRQKATKDALKAVHDALSARGINIVGMEMTNVQYQKAFEHAVELKVTAIQKAIEEQNRTKQIQEQARQTVLTAQASAESMRIRANALQQNAKLVEYEAVQKWDGKMPQYMMGGAVPFINLK
jgi:regulator of protease activity HflC (stomatin/prohibitin superfamily)